MNAKKEWGCLIRKKVFVLQGENGFFRRDRDKRPAAGKKKKPKLNMRNGNILPWFKFQVPTPKSKEMNTTARFCGVGVI